MMRVTSLKVAKIIRLSSRAMPARMPHSWIFCGTGRRKSISMRQKSIWPPSSTGTGSRLRMARLMLMSAARPSTPTRPCSACWPTIWAIMMGPPTWSAGTTRWASLTKLCQVRSTRRQVWTRPVLSASAKPSSSTRTEPSGPMPMSQAFSSSPKMVLRVLHCGVRVSSSSVPWVMPSAGCRATVRVRGRPLAAATVGDISSHELRGRPSMPRIRSPFCRPACAAALRGMTVPTCGSMTALPQPQATTQHRMQASRMLAKGPAAITRKRCHAGRREKHSSRVKPLGMSFSSFSPTRAT